LWVGGVVGSAPDVSAYTDAPVAPVEQQAKPEPAALDTFTPVPAMHQSVNAEQYSSMDALTPDQRRWLKRWFRGHEALFARIVFCESRFSDDAISSDGARGRLQIMEMHAHARGYSALDLHDPEIAGMIGADLLALKDNAYDWVATRDGCEGWSR